MKYTFFMYLAFLHQKTKKHKKNSDKFIIFSSCCRLHQLEHVSEFIYKVYAQCTENGNTCKNTLLYPILYKYIFVINCYWRLSQANHRAIYKRIILFFLWRWIFFLIFLIYCIIYKLYFFFRNLQLCIIDHSHAFYRTPFFKL